MASTWATTETSFCSYLLATGHAPSTAQTYLSILRLFRKWCRQRETNPIEVSRPAIESYLADQLLHIGRNTVVLRLAALRAFFAFLGRHDATEGLRIKSERIAARQPFSQVEVDLLLSGCRNERDRAMILIGRCCGLRVSEIVGLTAEDIDLVRAMALVRGKGSKQRWVGLPSQAIQVLAPFLLGATGPIWHTREGRPLSVKRAQRNLEEIARRAHVRAHWHRLRTTFAVDFIEQCHDIQALQGVMGHESIETTARYAEYTKMKRGLDYMRRLTWE